MRIHRRSFLAQSAAALALTTSPAGARPDQPKQQSRATGATETSARHGNRIIVSTYSFWQFKNRDLRDIEKCMDLAADMGFDGVEILHRQMENESNDYLQRLKRRMFLNGMHLCGFSTHQGFLSPDAAFRQKNVDHTIHCMELAYKLESPRCASTPAPGEPAKTLMT
jgi:hypothetical protein